MTLLAAEQSTWARDKAELGVSATYRRTPGGGDAIEETLTVVLNEDSGLFENDPDVERYQRLAFVDLDVNPGFTVENRGTFTINSEIWQVLRPAGRDRVIQSWKIGLNKIQNIAGPRGT